MSIVIKAKPEDFIVDEKSTINFLSQGVYSFYRLTKKGLNTVDAIREISKITKVPSYLFSYGGKKDRHASTSQLISVNGHKPSDISLEHLSFSFCGYSDRPMGPDLIDGNHFEITVRRLDRPLLQKMIRRLELVKTQGFPNYFDDQRFGSFDSMQGFLAEKLLLGHFNGALKIYLTSIYAGDSKNEKERRAFFLKYWKDWDACQTRASNAFERSAFKELKKGEKAFVAVVNQIPQEELSMYFSAYQSFLWNETARRLIKQKVNDPLVTIQGVAGEYLFYESLSDEDFKILRSLNIPTAAHNTQMPDELLSKIYAEVLTERAITKAMFNKLKVRKAFFKAMDRFLITIPSHLSWKEFPDEIYTSQRKLVIKFFLGRGSYATMLIKSLVLE